jgi:Rieske [2Fe-2S] domain
LQRKRGARETGIGTGILAWIVSMAAAYLGGYLVYDQRVGVDHAQRGGPENWMPVMIEDGLVENKLHRVSADGVDILLVKKDGRILAIGEKCAHLGGRYRKGNSKATLSCVRGTDRNSRSPMET